MKQRKKGVTLGTGFMLILTGVVLAASLFVLLRLGSGHTVDLSRLRQQVFPVETAAPGPEASDHP